MRKRKGRRDASLPAIRSTTPAYAPSPLPAIHTPTQAHLRGALHRAYHAGGGVEQALGQACGGLGVEDWSWAGRDTQCTSAGEPRPCDVVTLACSLLGHSLRGLARLGAGALCRSRSRRE